ncbi:hypothetical protein U9K52_01165 [Chryseobacterium sp. MHB01]|uniref:hypothetical protein n=1 Tax=Chryseobacterium sp. MHB01 TaxID=3109433 RepID=UPI002AFDD53A|nr:hypothetical protein [Chryseobacterium sp. MHB01]MEA1847508.1 hypothetical protein [Chryseobacterium sp. MHB01]
MLRRIFDIFIQASDQFVENERDLILSTVSERCLCGSFMLILRRILDNTEFNNYFTDIEYNRNEGRVKTIINDEFETLNITCDLIIHSRGNIINQDNLLAIEMKRDYHPLDEKIKDKKRLKALTQPISEVTEMSNGGFPINVCGYILGVYYEISVPQREIFIEYYVNGNVLNNYRKRI